MSFELKWRIQDGDVPPGADVREVARELARVDCSVMPSKAVQSEKDACDINRIVARFDQTGMLNHLARGVPRFLDVSEIQDFKTTTDKVLAVGRWFEELPAPIRRVFDNDPVTFVERINDPSYEAKLLELGLGPVVKKAAEGVTPPAA